MVSQMTLKKPTAAETTGPALEAENRGCLHSFLLAQNSSFSWDFHSLLSPEGGKKSQLLLDGDLASQQGPVSSGGYQQVWGGWRAPQLHLGVGTRKNRMRLCQSGGTERQGRSVLSMGEKKNTQSSSDSLSPSRRNGTPRCEKDYLQKHLFLPIPEWHPSFWLTSLSWSRNVRRQNRYIYQGNRWGEPSDFPDTLPVSKTYK